MVELCDWHPRVLIVGPEDVEVDLLKRLEPASVTAGGDWVWSWKSGDGDWWAVKSRPSGPGDASTDA